MKSNSKKMVSVGEVLQRTQKDRTQHIFVVTHLQKNWQEVVGEFLYNQTYPKKILRNVLWISVEHSALAYELSMMKETIMEKIKAIATYPFKDLKFVHEDVVHRVQQAVLHSRRKFERPKVESEETLDSILARIRELSAQLRK